MSELRTYSNTCLANYVTGFSRSYQNYTAGVTHFHRDDDSDDDDDDDGDDDADADDDAADNDDDVVDDDDGEENTQAHLHISSPCVHHNAPGLGLSPSSALLRSENVKLRDSIW